jgi:CubicO group peptidase (beta-lactamase class C family)
MRLAARALLLAFLVLATSSAWAADLEIVRARAGRPVHRAPRADHRDAEGRRREGPPAGRGRTGRTANRVAYFEAVGFRDRAPGAPLRRDDIFRIYSMTKPITSVAVMMLRDEGRLDLGDPISRYLPPLTKLQVGVEQKDATTGQVTLALEPSKRDMTIQDLLRHTSGLTYGVFGSGEVKKLYADRGIDSLDQTNAEMIEKLSKVPLMSQPGSVWEYGRSTDVLGHLVEVASGRSLSQFFEERIFRPLKMKDSAFSVPEPKHSRIAQPFAKDPDTQRPITLFDVTKPPKFEAGGQAGVSTAMDYARFSQMLLNRGRLDGVRLLSRKTVEQMTADHLGRLDGPPRAGASGSGSRSAARSGSSRRPARSANTAGPASADLLLDRSEGGARRYLDDAGAGARCALSARVQEPRPAGDHGLARAGGDFRQTLFEKSPLGDRSRPIERARRYSDAASSQRASRRKRSARTAGKSGSDSRSASEAASSARPASGPSAMPTATERLRRTTGVGCTPSSTP